MKKDKTSTKKEKSKKPEKTEGEVKDIYFILLYPRKQPENPEEFVFDENSINPQNIFKDETKQDDGTFFYKKIFKFNGKTEKKYNLEFDIGKDNYIVSFKVKKNIFVYDVELKK